MGRGVLQSPRPPTVRLWGGSVRAVSSNSRGDDLNEGLVFREFVEFEPVGVPPQEAGCL